MKSRKLNRILFLIPFTVLMFNIEGLNAQEDSKDDHKRYQTFNLSYVFGGQVYNDNFIYNPGIFVNYSIGKQIHDDISVGFGAGYMPLSNEQFLPVYAEIIGNKKKKDNSPFIRFQAGYSFGWTEEEDVNENHELTGGIFFNAGLGRRIKINDNYTVLFQWSYCHQFAEMEYEIFGDREYEEVLNYDMLHLTIALVLH